MTDNSISPAEGRVFIYGVTVGLGVAEIIIGEGVTIVVGEGVSVGDGFGFNVGTTDGVRAGETELVGVIVCEL